jgi:hypothetical protein
MKELDLSAYRYDIAKFSEHVLGVKPNPAQRRVFEVVQERDNNSDNVDAWRYLDIVVTSGNRAGKTTALAIICLWAILYKIGLPPPSNDSEEELLRWLRQPYNWYHLSYEIKVSKLLYDEIERIFSESHPAQSAKIGCPLRRAYGEILTFESNALATRIKVNSIFGGGELHIRHTDEKARALLGLTMNGISFDECAFERYLTQIRNEVLHLRRLSTGGPIIYVSTPALGFGEFYDLVQSLKGDDRAVWVRMSTRDNIGYGLDERLFEELLRSIPPSLVKQNIDGEFVQDVGAYFSQQSVTQSFVNEATSQHQDGDRYVVGCDPALTYDDAWIIVARVRKDKIEVCEIKRFSSDRSMLLLVDEISRLVYLYRSLSRNIVPCIIDSTSFGGHAFGEALQHLGDSLHQYTFNSIAKKRDILTSLRLALDDNKIIVSNSLDHADTLRRQLISYRLDDQKLQQDGVITLAMITWFIQKYMRYQASLAVRRKFEYFNVAR